MMGMGEKLWAMGRSPSQHMTLLVFGLLSLLTGVVAISTLAVAGGGGGATSIIMAATVLIGVGGFFVTLALFLGAYAATGDSWATTVCRTAPRSAAVRRLPDGHLAFREHAILGTDERGDECGMLRMRMSRNREPELRREAFGDFRPPAAVGPAVVRPAMILLEDRAVSGGIPGQLVDALSPLRILVRHEPGPDPLVLHGPRATAVARLERPDRADPDDKMLRISRIHEDRMQAQAAIARLPFFPGRMIVESLEVLPRSSAVVAAEQGRGFDARVDRFRFVGGARLDMPDPCDGEVRSFLELRRGLCRFHDLAGASAIDRGSPWLAPDWRGPVYGAAVPRGEDHVVHRIPHHERSRDRPLPTIG